MYPILLTNSELKKKFSSEQLIIDLIFRTSFGEGGLPGSRVVGIPPLGTSGAESGAGVGRWVVFCCQGIFTVHVAGG